MPGRAVWRWMLQRLTTIATTFIKPYQCRASGPMRRSTGSMLMWIYGPICSQPQLIRKASVIGMLSIVFSLSLRSNQPERKPTEVDHRHTTDEQQHGEHTDTGNERRHSAQCRKAGGSPDGLFSVEGAPAVQGEQGGSHDKQDDGDGRTPGEEDRAP